jgi:hypothetical protein
MRICRGNQKKLCGKEKEECGICYKRSFANYNGTTNKGFLKIECWDDVTF